MKHSSEMRKRVMSTRELRVRTHERETKKSEQSSGSKKNKSVSNNKSVVTSSSILSKEITPNRKAAKSSHDFVSSQKTSNAGEGMSKKRRRGGIPMDNGLPEDHFEEDKKLDKKSKESRAEILETKKKRDNKREHATAATATPKVDEGSSKILEKSSTKKTPVKVTKTKKKGANKKGNIEGNIATVDIDTKVDEVVPSGTVDKRRSLRTRTSAVNTETVIKPKNKNKHLDNNPKNNLGTSQLQNGEVSDMEKELGIEKTNNVTVEVPKVDEPLEVAKEFKSATVPVQVSRNKKKHGKTQENTAAVNPQFDEVASSVSKKRRSLRTKTSAMKAETATKVSRKNKRVNAEAVPVVDSGLTEPETIGALDVEKSVDVKASPVVNETSRNKQVLQESSALTKLGTITMRRPQKKVESRSKVESKILLDKSQINSDRSILPLDGDVPVNTPSISKPITSVEQTERTSKAPSLPRKLRHRVLQDYAESSLEGSKTEEAKPEEAQQNNVPIYKRKLEEIPVLGKKKCETDLYEFDSDVEDGARKKKKRKLDDSYYDEYNKTISNIMQKIKKNIKNKQANKNRKGEDKNPNPKQEIQEHNAETKARPEVKRKVLKHNAELVKPKTLNNRKKQTNHAISRDSMKNVTVQLVPLNLDRIKDNVQALRAEKKLDLNKNKEMPADESDGDYSDHNFDNLVSEPYVDEDFDEFLPPTMGSDRVHVVRNVLLVPSKSAVSPWRFSQRNVTRNPHFITLKPSALPAVNQEMVLDHTMVDKFDELSRTRCEKTPPDSTIPKKSAVVQTTVTDFFKSSGTQLKENPRLSLFDCEDFSPIKNPVTNALISVETRSSVKRKILTENVNPNQMASTPIREAVVRHPETIDISAVRKPAEGDTRDIESCFGFDSDDEQDGSTTPKAARKSAKPFRLSGKVVMKQYERKEKPKTIPEVSEQAAEKLPEKTTEKATEDAYSESDSEESEVQSTIPEVGGIFQDLSNAEKELKLKEPKQKKLKWLIDDDDDILKFKKKRKDVRTKEEEEAAEKWAADFNSMCEEIDQFPLEIE